MNDLLLDEKDLKRFNYKMAFSMPHYTMSYTLCLYAMANKLDITSPKDLGVYLKALSADFADVRPLFTVSVLVCLKARFEHKLLSTNITHETLEVCAGKKNEKKGST